MPSKSKLDRENERRFANVAATRKARELPPNPRAQNTAPYNVPKLATGPSPTTVRQRLTDQLTALRAALAEVERSQLYAATRNPQHADPWGAQPADLNATRNKLQRDLRKVELEIAALPKG